MKKRLGLLVIFVIVFMGMGACKQLAVNEKSSGHEETGNTLWELDETEVKNIEYGTEEALLTGKKLDNLTRIGTDDTFYCNLEENMKPE